MCPIYSAVKLSRFKGIRIQVVSCEELVEVCAVAFCESGGLGDVAHGDLQDL